MSWRIPLADLSLGDEEKKAVLEVLESRWLTMGSVTQQFEAEFGAFCGARHAIAVTNCTAALHLACAALDLGPGDEVIVPSLTFVATANAVRYTGATPIFADIHGTDDLTIDPSAVEAAITPRTRAILVMHYGGFCCDLPQLAEIAAAHHLALIEDAAHCSGARLDGRALGTWGEMGCFSFFSNKNMTTGEGGMLVTGDDALAARLLRLRSHGMTSLTWDRHRGHAWSYDVVDLGYNYRIDELRAAIGLAQLHKLAGFNRRRAEIVAHYRARLPGAAPGLQLPFTQHPGESSHHIFPVLLPAGADRVRFMEEMKIRGIQTSIHYPPIHLFSAYRSLPQPALRLPNTEDVSSREVTLPLFPAMSDADVDEVIAAAASALHVINL